MQPLLILELLKSNGFLYPFSFFGMLRPGTVQQPHQGISPAVIENWHQQTGQRFPNITNIESLSFCRVQDSSRSKMSPRWNTDHRFPWNPWLLWDSERIPKCDEGSSSLPRLNLRATLRPCSSFAGWASKKSCIFSHQLGHVHLMGYTRKTRKWAGMFVNIPENGLECSAKNGLCSCIPKFETRGTTFSGHFVVFNTAVRGVSNLDSYQRRDRGRMGKWCSAWNQWSRRGGTSKTCPPVNRHGLLENHHLVDDVPIQNIQTPTYTGFPIAMYLD